MKALKFRKACIHDKPILLEFEQQVLEAERPFNSNIKLVNTYYYDLDGLLTSNKSHLLVAEVNDCVIGSGYAQIRTSKQSLTHDLHSYLGFMYVVPDYRGHGINKLLVEQLIEWSKTQGALDCYLDVYSENKAAIRAYEKTGFTSSMIEMKMSLKKTKNLKKI